MHDVSIHCDMFCLCVTDMFSLLDKTRQDKTRQEQHWGGVCFFCFARVRGGGRGSDLHVVGRVGWSVLVSLSVNSDHTKNLSSAKWTKIDQTKVGGRQPSITKRPPFAGKGSAIEKR